MSNNPKLSQNLVALIDGLQFLVFVSFGVLLGYLAYNNVRYGYEWPTCLLIVIAVIALCAWRDKKSSHIYKAHEAERKGNADEAVSILLESAKHNVKDIRAYVTAVQIRMRQKRYEQAVEICDEALRNNPDNVEITCNRIWANFKLRNLDQALLDEDRALKLDPSCFYAAFKRMETLRALHRYKDAGVAADNLI